MLFRSPSCPVSSNETGLFHTQPEEVPARNPVDSGYPITREREKTLRSAMEQIVASVDDLDERVSLSNQRELEAAEQHGPEMPENIHNQGGIRFE